MYRVNDITRLALQFRKAIENAKNADMFYKDIVFRQFPHGCCGDASDLLAQYLMENGMETYYVCGTARVGPAMNRQTHAWLMTDCGILIDITGDQFETNSAFLFNNVPVYVGKEDRFHRLFEVEARDVHKFDGIDALGHMCQARLHGLYGKILDYIH